MSKPNIFKFLFHRNSKYGPTVTESTIITLRGDDKDATYCFMNAFGTPKKFTIESVQRMVESSVNGKEEKELLPVGDSFVPSITKDEKTRRYIVA